MRKLSPKNLDIGTISQDSFAFLCYTPSPQKEDKENVKRGKGECEEDKESETWVSWVGPEHGEDQGSL